MCSYICTGYNNGSVIITITLLIVFTASRRTLHRSGRNGEIMINDPRSKS